MPSGNCKKRCSECLGEGYRHYDGIYGKCLMCHGDGYIECEGSLSELQKVAIRLRKALGRTTLVDDYTNYEYCNREKRREARKKIIEAVEAILEKKYADADDKDDLEFMKNLIGFSDKVLVQQYVIKCIGLSKKESDEILGWLMST